MAGCPQCDQAMEAFELDGARAERCTRCSGLWVTQAQLVPLLEKAGACMFGDVDVDQEVEPIPDRAGHLSCPSCHRAMSAFGYMGTKLVHLDRCNACACLWLDPGELATAALLFVRTQRRGEERRTMYAGSLMRLDRVFMAQLAANRVFNRMMR